MARLLGTGYDGNIKGQIISSGPKLLKASSKMASATFLSRVLGLIREQVLAHSFGASGLTDCFNVAYRIPNMLRDLFAEGAFSSAFVPVFLEEGVKGTGHARDLLWSLFWVLGGITFGLSALIFAGAPFLVKTLSPSFAADPELFQITVGLTRWMAPFLGLVSVAALWMGALNSRKVFFIPALAPACFNVVAIFSITHFPGLFEKYGYQGIMGLGLGVTLGGFAQLLLQWPQLRKVGLNYIRPKKFFTPAVKKVFWMLGPGLLGYAATQINILVNTILATGAGIGAVSWLTYAFRLFQFPVGILGVSLGNSNLVHFSEAWKEGRTQEAKGLLKTGIYLSSLSMFPACFLFLGLAVPAVNIVFERGQFDHVDTLNTALALSWYSIGLPFYGLYKLFTPLFYTLGKPKYPVICSVAGIFLNILFSTFFVSEFGFSTLAIGTTLALFLNTLLQAHGLRKLMAAEWREFFSIREFKIFIASFVCWPLTSYLTDQFFHFNSSLLLRVLDLVWIGVAGVLSYVLLLFVFGEASGLIPFALKLKRRFIKK